MNNNKDSRGGQLLSKTMPIAKLSDSRFSLCFPTFNNLLSSSHHSVAKLLANFVKLPTIATSATLSSSSSPLRFEPKKTRRRVKLHFRPHAMNPYNTYMDENCMDTLLGVTDLMTHIVCAHCHLKKQI